MPIHLITADAFMVSPESLQKSWSWPPWECIQHAKENNVEDHPWFKLQEPVKTGSPQVLLGGPGGQDAGVEVSPDTSRT